MAKGRSETAAVVLAGGVNRIELYPGCEPGYKALLNIRGRPCLMYTLEALAGSGRIGEVCIVGEEERLRPALSGWEGPLGFVPGGQTLMESIFGGLRHFRQVSRVLVATADIPLVHAKAVTEFLDTCERKPSPLPEAFYIAVVPRECYTGPYRDFAKPFNRFRDVAICHGNLALATPSILDNTDAVSRINDVYSARKSPVKSALATGLRVGLSYVLGVHLLHTLTLDQMASIASNRFGVAIIPVLVRSPEITVDLDEPADWELVSRIMDQTT